MTEIERDSARWRFAVKYGMPHDSMRNSGSGWPLAPSWGIGIDIDGVQQYFSGPDVTAVIDRAMAAVAAHPDKQPKD